jgi:uncharacterized membrane protein (DUF485 family)
MTGKEAEKSGSGSSTVYKTRLGIWMFFCYLIIYAAFVAINVGKPLLMERTVCCGLNLATVFGFGLIVLALILALIYDGMCRKREVAMQDT